MALAGLLTNILMGGSQKNPKTGQRNWGTGKFWGDVGKSLIPQGGGQLVNQIQGQRARSNLPPQKQCPDPFALHPGETVMMNLTSMYGQPMYVCPVCSYQLPAGTQTTSTQGVLGG